MSTKQDEILNKRRKNYNDTCKMFLSEGYKKEKAVISIVKANILAFVTAGPFIVLFIILFINFNVVKSIQLSDYFAFPKIFIIFAILILSIPVHEFLHGLFWSLFCKEKWRSINFGIMWSSLTPYCHCREALSVSQYYAGLLAPFLILGIIPSIVSIFTGNLLLFIAGIYNILAAGGDTTIGCLILKYFNKNNRLLDHPEECGCTVFIK